jgi:hypothetical protein
LVSSPAELEQVMIRWLVNAVRVSVMLLQHKSWQLACIGLSPSTASPFATVRIQMNRIAGGTQVASLISDVRSLRLRS